MRLILKNTLKNIKSNLGRTVLMVIMVAFASFTAMMTLDMPETIENICKGIMRTFTGNADIYLNYGDMDFDQSDLPEASMIGVYNYESCIYSRSFYYEYVDNKYVVVACIDNMSDAYNMKVINENYQLADDEIIITDEYSKTFSVNQGDRFTIKNNDGNDVEFKVKSIIKCDNTNLLYSTALVNENAIRKLECSDRLKYSYILVDVKDDKKVEEYLKILKEKAPYIEAEDMIGQSISDFGVNQMKNTFYLMFLILSILVGFISVSTSEKLVCERMPLIGTLRSLGVSKRKTTLILLLENASYAIIGSVIGIVLYSIARTPVLNLVFMVEATGASKEDCFKPIPFYAYILVFLFMLCLVCWYPSVALTETIKTPIRDIIFNTKNTEYKYTKSKIYIAIILFFIGVVTSFMNRSFVGICISITTIFVSLIMIAPYLLLLIGKGVEKICDRKEKLLIKYAVKNIYNNKSIVSTTVLLVASLLMSLFITNLSATYVESSVTPSFDCDVVWNSDSTEDEVGFLKDADLYKNMEMFYGDSCACEINKEPIDYMWVTYTYGKKDYLPTAGITNELTGNEVAIHNSIAKRFNLKEGDEFEIVFNTSYIFPQKTTLVVKDIYYYNSNGDTMPIVMSEEKYLEYFDNVIRFITFDTDSPDELRNVILSKYPRDFDSVSSIETIKANLEYEARQTRKICDLIILFTVLLTFIGISGNQTLSFNYRKRELAGIYSTAMSKKKIFTLILLETGISLLIATIVAWIGNPLFTYVMNSAMDIVSNYDMQKINVSVYYCTLYTLGLMLVFLGSALIPIRKINRMNIANELKYE